MNKETKLMLLHIPAAVVFGLIGYFITASRITNWANLVLLLISCVIMKFLSDKFIGEKKDFKFWLGLCGTIFIFVWFMSWLIFYNLLGV